MTDLARLRSDLRAFSRAIEQPLTDWRAESFSLERRTTALVVSMRCPTRSSRSGYRNTRARPARDCQLTASQVPERSVFERSRVVTAHAGIPH
jgi:hypothetical protein